MKSSVHFQTCVLRINRQGHLLWRNLSLGSGFQVQLSYAKNVQVDADVIGLNDDFDLTSPLAHFLALNQELVVARLAQVEETLASYRLHRLKECQWKLDVLT